MSHEQHTSQLRQVRSHPEERYLIREYEEGKQVGTMLRDSTPDHLFLVQKILNHLNTVPHLNLRPFGHGQHGTD